MRQITLAGLLSIFISFAAAQNTSNFLTVSVSRALTVQPDQEVFGVFVSSGDDQTLSDVLAVLQPAGITAANFSNVYGDTYGDLTGAGTGASPAGSSLQWSFTLTAPLTNTKATVAMLTNLQNSVAKTHPKLQVSFDLQGTQVSAQAAQSQTCPLAALISDANAKAQTMAAAANRFVSGIVALATDANPGQTICSISVKFSLVGF